MTFKDLKFIPHKVIPKSGIQATLEVKPQVFVSVIAGDGFYSTAKGTGVRGAVTSEKNVSTFEVGIIDESVDKDKQEWDVRGFQNREEINELLATFI
jgi:hypothetical protein|tara:strand:- start:334 stop:624 length:291 start_codon:yes stop_codon:yes gene_type:complete